MRVSTIIILAVATMALATFAHPRECRHSCRMDSNGVVSAAVQSAPVMMASSTH